MSDHPTTTLGHWMVRAGESDRTLADKLGCSRVHVSRLRRGLYNPRRDLALKLEKLTGISAAIFMLDKPSDARAA